MTLLELVEGVVQLGVVVASVSAASVGLIRRWLPRWSGPPARLAQAVAGIALLLLIGQLLGTVGLFGPWPVAAVSAAVGGSVWRWAGRSPHPHADRTRRDRRRYPTNDPVVGAVSVAMAAVVVAQWTNGAIQVSQHGLSDFDSLAYQAPFAARFLQEGWVTRLHLVFGAVPYYPANAELLQAVAMLPFHRDFFLPFVNLGWLALAFLAAWCVGRPFGVAPLALAGVAAVCSSPLLVDFNAGTASSDIAVLALVLAAVALIVNSGWRSPAIGLAGAAAGLAMGTKLNALPPMAFLALGLPWVIPAQVRRSRTIWWLMSVATFGSFWYLRNLVRVGNPVAFGWFSLGPLSVPGASRDRLVQDLGDPLLTYGLHPGNWGELLTGLRYGLGPAWPAVVLLAGAGVVASIVTRGQPVRRLLGLVGAAAAVSYVLTPNSAGGFEGVGGFFGVNLRYAVPALALGLVLVPLASFLASERRVRCLLIAQAAIVVANQAGTGPYATWPEGRRVFAITVITAVLVTVWVGADRWRRQRRLVPLVSLVAGAVALALGAGWTGWFRLDTATSPMTPADRWAQHISDQHIAAVTTPIYFLYGSDLSNRVEVPMAKSDQRDATPIRTCHDWRRALDRGGYGYAVIRNESFVPSQPRQVDWTRTIPGATEVLSAGGTVVFRLPDEVTTAGCPSVEP